MTNGYDNQTIFSYLLGSLPDADSERIDEMTFTDPGFAEAIKIAEKDLVDSYVNGELDGETLEKFETHYLASPIRRKKVTFAQAFGEFAEHETLNEKPLPATEPLIQRKGWISTFLESLGLVAGGRLTVGFAAAAGVLVLVLLGGFLLIRGLMDGQRRDERAGTTNNNQIEPVNIVAPATPVPTSTVAPINGSGSVNKPTPSPEPSSTPKAPPVRPEQPAIAAFILPPPLRGASPLTSVRLEADTQFADFTMGLESNDFVSYKIELRPAGGASIWQVGHLKARGSKSASLNARVPAKLLKAQIYSFSVSGIAADGTTENIGDYSFRVMR